MWLTSPLIAFVFVVVVVAHGRITSITTSTGTIYKGWDPESAQSSASLPEIAAWAASNLGNTFVNPLQFNTSNITCHYNAVPGALHVNTNAGEMLKLQWNEWPISHVGPVLTYLAACNGSCQAVDKNNLQWVKIDQLGWLNSTGWDELMLGGTWATDILIRNRYTWMVKIPDLLEAGNYVLRHEIIALHVADQLDGAQAYPQCVNIQVARSKTTPGKLLEGGVLGKDLYSMVDEGVLVDVHRKLTGYTMPGPKVWATATPLTQPNQ